MGYGIKAQQLDSKVHRPYYAGEYVQESASERFKRRKRAAKERRKYKREGLK